MNDLVSVIIPTYNRAKTIYRSIQSILNQTYNNLEIIIVDDGSIDNSREIIKSFDDNRIIYIYQNNSGACVARNTGIKHAKGKYIAFQDSDDEWAPNKIESQLHCLVEGNYDFVFCRMKTIQQNKSWITPSLKFRQEDISFKKLKIANFVSTQMILEKKEVALSNLFDNSFLRFQDWDYCMRIFQNYSIGFCPETLVTQYIQNDSLTVNVKKTISACSEFEKKYIRIYDNKEKAALYDNFGTELSNSDIMLSSKYFVNSLKSHFTLKTLCKLILLQIHYSTKIHKFF